MKLIKTDISGLFILKPVIYKDKRGSLIESYSLKKSKKLFGEIDFIQDNDSTSCKGTLRGLHFQNPPFSQTKLVRCLHGKILDVAVDLRKNSKTFGQYQSILLTASNKFQLFIPKGFAHGFVVLSEFAIVSYKVDNYYSPKHESGIIWNDNKLNIDWKVNPDKIIMSENDRNLLPLTEIKNPF